MHMGSDATKYHCKTFMDINTPQRKLENRESHRNQCTFWAFEQIRSPSVGINCLRVAIQWLKCPCEQSTTVTFLSGPGEEGVGDNMRPGNDAHSGVNDSEEIVGVTGKLS